MLRRTALTTIMCLACASYAGNEVRNGGDAIVCRDGDGKITSVEVLDTFEMREIHGLKFDLGDSSVSVEMKLDTIAGFLRKNSPLRAQIYSEKFSVFFKEALFLNANL